MLKMNNSKLASAAKGKLDINNANRKKGVERKTELNSGSVIITQKYIPFILLTSVLTTDRYILHCF